ncbi:MAG: circularly permuted type 2 ATP-grasp protein [Verrucomicrobiota bacterium]
MSPLSQSQSQSLTPGAPLASDYHRLFSANDEMLATDGSILPGWEELLRHFSHLDPTSMERLRTETERMIRENGVTYSVHGDPSGRNRPWTLDPMPLLITQSDWAIVETGLIQRSELLAEILRDLYGSQRLIAEGLLPMEIVYQHQDYLRACQNIETGSSHPIFFTAADIARGPNGRMWVINDRTQSPSGSGYALENREITTRVMPGLFHRCRIRRLAGFYRAIKQGLSSLSPRDEARTVLLTPGPFNETYFEHAYLASYLGYTLVQGQDLTMRDGKVWIQTLEGLEQVDVILRRVDAPFCDPLEFLPDSQLGVPGLLEAVRAGQVAIANPLGAGLLENPALMAFLPGICQRLRGEELILPSAATWWCGQKKECHYVLENLERLVIKTIHRSPNYGTVFGEQLSASQRSDLRARIEAKPWLYLGQEHVSFSTAPSLVGNQLQPRHTVVRTYVGSDGQNYRVMPGGLSRSAPQEGHYFVSGQSGGISKDTWVVGDGTEPYVSLWSSGRDGAVLAQQRKLPSRAGENLFWTGRYAERTEGTVRLLRVILGTWAEELHTGAEQISPSLRLLLQAAFKVLVSPPQRALSPETKLDQAAAEIRSLLVDQHRSGSLSGKLSGFSLAAYAVRDLWSAESWRTIDEATEHWKMVEGDTSYDLLHYPPDLARLLTLLNAFTGLNLENMTREAGWCLLDIGRRIERSQMLISLLRSTLVKKETESVNYHIREAVLRFSDSMATHRRRYLTQPTASSMIELLLLATDNPRSLLYQIQRLQRHLGALPRPASERLSQEECLALDAETRLQLCDVNELSASRDGRREALDDLLKELGKRLEKISSVIHSTYFRHARTQTVTG